MRKIISALFILAFLLPFPIYAQQLEGDWKGFIDVNGTHLTIITHFERADSLVQGSIDIPQQGAKGLPLQNIRAEVDSVFFEFNTGLGLARFEGLIDSSNISGSFYQTGRAFPFELHKVENKITQKPKKEQDLPYHRKELVIKRDSIVVAGTLTYPKNDAIGKGVILISGSGAQNRDEEVAGFKIFAQIADYLSRNGIAVFRFDDRGVGESTGSADASLNALTDDVEAIYSFLKQREELENTEIGLFGHSQGGIIAAKLAVKSSDIPFIILMASPAYPLSEVIMQQMKTIPKKTGIPDSVIRENIDLQQKIYSVARGKKDTSAVRGALIEKALTQLKNLPKQQQEAIGDLKTYARNAANQQLKLLKSDLFTSLLDYDPTKDLRKIDIPVLAIFGGKDLQVLAEQNKKRMKKALSKSEADFKIKIFENANHLFQNAKTGLPNEYPTLQKQFVEDFLPTIEQWIYDL